MVLGSITNACLMFLFNHKVAVQHSHDLVSVVHTACRCTKQYRTQKMSIILFNGTYHLLGSQCSVVSTAADVEHLHTGTITAYYITSTAVDTLKSLI